MPDKKYTKSGRRNIIDYSNVVSDAGEYVVVCLNKAVLGIARKFLATRALWPTSYATYYGDDGYDVPSSVEMGLVQDIIHEFMEDTSDMDCSDFAQKLDDIVSAINSGGASSGCGCGSGGAGSDDTAESTETVDPPGTPSGTYPAEFASLAEYESYKCDVADWIVQSLRDDVVTYSGMSIAVSVAVFGSLLITPVPGARIVALLWAVIALSGLAAGVFTSFLNVIDNNRDDLVCALFNATDAANAKTDYEAEFDTGVDAETSDLAWRFAIKQVFDLMLSNFVINKLFEKDDFTTFPSASCSACGVPQWWNTIHGNVIDYGTDWVDLQAISTSGDYWAGVGHFKCPTEYTWSFSVIDGTWTSPSGTPSAVVNLEQCPTNNGAAGGGGWDVVYATLETNPPATAAVIQVRSNTQITIRFQFT